MELEKSTSTRSTNAAVFLKLQKHYYYSACTEHSHQKSRAGNRCCHFQPQPKAAHSHEHRRTVSAAYQKGNAAGAAAQAAN